MKKIANLTLLTTVVTGATIPSLQSWANEVVNDFNQKVQTKTTSTINGMSRTFNLDNWTYQDNGSEIVLSGYNDLPGHLFIPGEYNGKRVIITDLADLPRDLTGLTIQEVNGQKVGLQTTSLKNAFYSTYNLTSVDLRGLDTSGVTNMQGMFKESSLKYADLSGLDVTSVTDMEEMFYNTGKSFVFDLTGWSLNPSVDTRRMFHFNDYNYGHNSGIVITTDPIITNFDFLTNNIRTVGPTFSATGLADTQSVTGKFQNAGTLVTPQPLNVIASREQSYIQGLINNIHVNAPTPTKDGYTFLNYESPYILQNNSLREIAYALIEHRYSSNWEKNLNQTPTINAPALTVGQGATNFNPLDYVTAEDPEDGPITVTEANIVSSDFNIDEPGVYQIVYEVSDSQGLTAQAIQTITVDGMPTIHVDSKIIQVGDSFDPLDGVTAEDPEDGPINLTLANVIQNPVDPDVPGSYQVWYEVQDSHGNRVQRWITVLVNEAPKLTLNTTVIQVGSSLDFLNWVTATDNEEGSINLTQSNTKVTHNINPDQPGIYQITYEVTDGHGGVTTQTFDIVVNDFPTIQTNHVTINVGDSFNALDHIIATDAFGNNIQLDQSNIVSSNVNPDQAGTYQVTYEVIDAYGYKSTVTINVTVKDKQENLLGAVTVGQGQNLTLNQIIQMTGNGYIDGNITITSSSVNLNQVGQYEIIFEYVNADGTISIIKLPVIVQAQQNGGNNGNQTIQLNPVKVEQNQNLTLNEIIQSTGNGYVDGNINITSSNVDLTKPGNYEIIFEYTQPDGTVSINKLPVIVEAQQNNGNNGTQNEIITEKPVYVQQGDKVDLNELIQSSNESFKDKVTTIISSNLDTTKSGNYEVIFEVQHNDGTTSLHKLPVIIEENQTVDNDNNQNNNGSQNGNQENSQNNGNNQSGATNEDDTSDKNSSSEDDREDIITGVSSAFLIPGAFSLWQGIRLLRRKK